MLRAALLPNQLQLSFQLASMQSSWGQRLTDLHLVTPLRILGMLIIALALTIAVRIAIQRLAKRVISIPGADRERSKVRQQALGTVMRSTLIGLIWAVTVVTVISETGVNIGAFVATATVVGGAIAFGAQTLVRDAIAGVFVIAEDQYGVGDQVDVGHATGSVERITLRSVRLRDGDGKVWHVPHGGILRTANLSKSPKAVLDLDVARTSPLEELEQSAMALCRALAADSRVSGVLISAPTRDGIIAVKDDRLVYRLSVVTRPGQHDDVRQRWQVHALQAFESGALKAPVAPSTVINVGRDGEQ
jgi:moderate conductance mechanosensitive channel